MKQILRVAVTAAIVLSAGSAVAQPAADPFAHPYIRSTGEATVFAKPDRARLDIGVVTQAPKAQAAAARNASETTAVVAALHQALGSSAEIRTSGYSLAPDFAYPKAGGQSVLAGYTVSNTVEITTGDLENVGKLIDAGTQAGANNVRSLQFLLKDEQPIRAQALREAAQKARAAAGSMASALGLKIARVLSVEEGTPQVIRPVRALSMAAMAAPATPIESGNIEVQATVTLTVEIAP
jgi:uncharacterized protein YggE